MRIKGNKDYSNRYMLERLRIHCVEQHKSVYTISQPIWATYQRRMAEDPEFKRDVQDIRAEADQYFEDLALGALRDDSFNVGVFKLLTNNKRCFQDYQTLELQQEINELKQLLKEANNGKV